MKDIPDYTFSEEILKELKSGKIQLKDLNDSYFICYADHQYADDENILKLLNNNICSFQQIVDKFVGDGTYSGLYVLLNTQIIFEKLFEANALSHEDLKYLLNKIKELDELRELCQLNTALIKCVLKEFILDKEIVDRFNAMIENNTWCYVENIHTIFDFIKYEHEHSESGIYGIDKEVMSLIELNTQVHLLNTFDLSLEQKLDLAEVLKDNEAAQNKLKQIVENHLENNYDFESLMSYLKKKEKKNLINL